MEKERLEFCIVRFDHYYDSINNKSTVFLSLSTFITGGLAAAYPTLIDKVNCGICIHLLMSILLALGLGNMIIVAFTSIPFIGRTRGSLLYFDNIAKSTLSDFSQTSTVETPEEALVDLRTQVHDLALGLFGKFRKLRIAGLLLLIQFVLFIPLITIVIFNLKK